MPAFICETCGSQFTPSVEPPPGCPICEDERQFAADEAADAGDDDFHQAVIRAFQVATISRTVSASGFVMSHPG